MGFRLIESGHIKTVAGIAIAEKRSLVECGSTALPSHQRQAISDNSAFEGEPFLLGLAQGRLQAEASSLELSVPVIPISRLPPVIGCRERVRGLRGLGGESRESWLRAVCVPGGLSLSWTPAWVEARRTDGQRSTLGAPLASGATYCHRNELEVWSWFIHFSKSDFWSLGR